ncbi:unnamed protein product [Knipowitschia caucasica]
MPVKREVIKELTPENSMRRSTRHTLAPKRLQYSPEENPDETPQKKMRKDVHRKKAQNSIQSATVSQDEGLSAYELERLENIRKNQEFLSSLKIYEISHELKQSVRPKPTQKGLKRLGTVQKEVLPPRRSQRLQNIEIDPLQNPDTTTSKQNLDSFMHVKKTSGPLVMKPINMSEDQLPNQLLKIWTENLTDKINTRLNLMQYKTALAGLKVTEERVAKVVKERIFSAAFHPCASSLLMAAGDKSGKVGLWSLSSSWGDDGVLLFEPHSRPVTWMAFSQTNPSDLLSTSYDGFMRHMDVEKAVFNNVYELDGGLKTFDFLSNDCMSLLVGSWLGEVAIVDRRTPGNSHESLHILNTKAVRCVSVHPLQKQYFAVAESQVVHIYDNRFLKKSNCTPVCQLLGHSKSISSAYFSPESGNRILTSCMDDCIRIYDTSSTTVAPLLNTIRHNMQTGRWLSKLTAVWDPKQEGCFGVGCMSRERCVLLYHESGQLLHRLSENLSTVQSVVAFHPSSNVLLGGNASGRLHLFT